MSDKIRNLLTVILLCIFIPSTFLMIRKQVNDRTGDDAYQEAIAIAKEEAPSSPTEETTVPTEAPPAPTAETTAPEPRMEWVPVPVPEDDPNLAELRSVDLAALQEVNADVLGWILIPGTKINYPVLQGEDNDYYLEHTWKKEANYMGSIFLECGNSPDFTDYNTVIYGHNLRSGAMFTAVRQYMNQKFYQEHPHVYLVTEEGIFRYDIFSSYLAALDGLTYGMVMNQETTRQSFLDYALEKSVIETSVVPAVTDSVITLSTCSGRGYSSRWVVHARLEKELVAQ